MRNRLPAWPYFSRADAETAAKVLRSGRINQWTGTEVTGFERDYARRLRGRKVIALANGSLALDLALQALEVGPGDEVVVTCRSFAASVHCVVLRGATPVFADVDRDSQNITPETVRRALTPRTKAVIAVHLAGWPCDAGGLLKLCRKRGVKLIEDCAQAHGAAIQGRPVGTFGDVSVFSFCQDKILTTGGEGGLFVTNDAGLFEKAWRLKDHGKDRALALRPHRSPSFKWMISGFGTNFRMTEMQAAIGRRFLRRLGPWVRRRRLVAQTLNEGLADCPGVRLTIPRRGIYHAYYKYYFFIRPEDLREGWSRDEILRRLSKAGVPCGSGVCPEIYLESAYQSHFRPGKGRPEGRLPTARRLGETSVLVHIHHRLAPSHARRFAKAIDSVMREAVRA